MRQIRVPLRIPLAGGGTDLPSWYEKHGSFFLSAAINKYIYITGSMREFDEKYWLSYSKVEVVDSISEIKHDLYRKAIENFVSDFDNENLGMEIHSISEVPGNSGLGSSGAFTVGVLSLLNSLKNKDLTKKEIAELACKIEINELNKSSGKQDQYIATYGGIRSFKINQNGDVDVINLNITDADQKRMVNNLFIYYSGIRRDSDLVLQDQAKKIVSNIKIQDCMHEIQEIAYQSRESIESGDLDKYGLLLDKHWKIKKRISNKMSDDLIDDIYNHAIKSGALGGKIMGAGGGGFFIFYVPEERHLSFRNKIKTLNLKQLNWNFDYDGVIQIYSS